MGTWGTVLEVCILLPSCLFALMGYLSDVGDVSVQELWYRHSFHSCLVESQWGGHATEEGSYGRCYRKREKEPGVAEVPFLAKERLANCMMLLALREAKNQLRSIGAFGSVLPC